MGFNSAFKGLMKSIETDGELQNKRKISNIKFFLHNDTD